ncbi:replication-relaxation family protein [Actinoallomurus sp. NPDC052274]|uniref:replication-relaxation family protein n=1 Tax=Actinoallomurus sp. NPDC052274 TaxID=3155420 RepID=UPI00343A00FD
MTAPKNRPRPRTTYVGSGRTRLSARPQVTPELIASLATRLTERDRWLLEILHEHRVLTTHQIRELAFPSISTTTHRLLALWQLRAVERFRPARATGSAPMHYVLGPSGAAVLAARRGLTVAQFGYRIDTTLAIAHSDKATHLVGCNGLFTALAAHARTHPDTELAAWWSERRCQSAWGKTVRPDGFGRWRQDGRQVDFFVEYDTGTEPLHRLLGKIADYGCLTDLTGISTPVLFALHAQAREEHLHDRITTRTPLIATATPAVLGEEGGPAGKVWRTIGAQSRRRLIDLAGGAQ